MESAWHLLGIPTPPIRTRAGAPQTVPAGYSYGRFELQRGWVLFTVDVLQFRLLHHRPFVSVPAGSICTLSCTSLVLSYLLFSCLFLSSLLFSYISSHDYIASCFFLYLLGSSLLVKMRRHTILSCLVLSCHVWSSRIFPRRLFSSLLFFSRLVSLFSTNPLNVRL